MSVYGSSTCITHHTEKRACTSQCHIFEIKGLKTSFLHFIPNGKPEHSKTNLNYKKMGCDIYAQQLIRKHAKCCISLQLCKCDWTCSVFSNAHYSWRHLNGIKCTQVCLLWSTDMQNRILTCQTHKSKPVSYAWIKHFLQTNIL